MSGTFEINGRRLQSIKSAANETSYSRDYITRLAREGKVVASQIGRQWFIDLDSLKQYESESAEEQKIRQQQLSEERRRERQAMDMVLSRYPNPKTPKRELVGIKRVAVAVSALGILMISVFQFAPLSMLSRQVAGALLVAESGDREKSEPDTNIALSATETDSQPVVFSAGTATVTAIKEIKNGILLLPHGTSTFDESRLENLFSDIITTTTDSNGLPYVVKKNDQGVVIEKIPYVVIPVNPKETP